MIKIKLILDQKNHQSWPILRSTAVHSLKSNGIQFVNDNPDVLLIHQIKFDPKYLNKNIPIILLERIDSACVTKRKEIKHPNIIGVIKNTIFRDPELNNAPVQYGRYHAKRIIETHNIKADDKLEFYDQKIILDNSDIEKIELGWTFALYKKMEEYTKKKIDFKAKRSMDVNFYGTVNYGEKTVAINFHRKLCIERIKQLKNCNVSTGSGRPLGPGQYTQLLLDSKISVSPWGLGEACYRDFEAIYMGSVLIKPDTSYVKGTQDIYQNNKYYIPCKLDFSDLQEKVDWVKKNWRNLTEHRIKARKYLMSWWDIEKYSNHMAKVFFNCVKRIK